MKKSYHKKIEYLSAGFTAASRINARNLKTILSDNQSTAYGQRYAFADIDGVEDYASRVPLTAYADYETDICQENAFTAYPIKNILGTSGTTGRQKLFPITENALSRYSSYIYDMPFHLTGASGKSLHTSVFRTFGDIDLLSSVYYSYLAESGALDCKDFAGGKELLFSNDVGNVPYVKAWLIVTHPEIVSIQSVFLYDVLLILRYLEDNWRRIINDVRRSEVSAELNGDIKSLLLQMTADEDRLTYLESVFMKKDGFTISDLLPSIKFVSGIGGKAYELQETALKKYIGTVPIYYFAYASSECMMGIAREIGKAEYTLLPDSAFYEFLPLGRSEPVMLEDLSVGECYEPVITTFSGLYRYQTGDIVRILSFEGESPVFEYVSRKDSLLNLAGEKLDEAMVRDAVKLSLRQADISAFDYAVGINDGEIPFGYALFLESDGKADGLSEKFDLCLRALSFDYDDIRALNMIAPPQVYLLGTGDLARARAADADHSHNKPRTLLDADRSRMLINFAKERKV